MKQKRVGRSKTLIIGFLILAAVVALILYAMLSDPIEQRRIRKELLELAHIEPDRRYIVSAKAIILDKSRESFQEIDLLEMINLNRRTYLVGGHQDFPIIVNYGDYEDCVIACLDKTPIAKIVCYVFARKTRNAEVSLNSGTCSGIKRFQGARSDVLLQIANAVAR